MLRKVLIGLVWFGAFYGLACIAVSAVAGGIAGAHDPAHAQQAGAVAGQQAVQEYFYVILVGSFALAAIGVATGILPGVKSSQPK